MARRTQEAILPQEPQRASRWRRRQRSGRVTAVLAIIAAIIALSLPAYGYYQEFIAPTKQLVAKVNDRSFDMEYYLKRLRLLRDERQSRGEPFELGELPLALIEDIINDELIRLGSPRLNIAIGPEELEQEILDRFGPLREAGKEIDEKELKIQARLEMQKRLKELEISDDEYREYLIAQLMRQKLKERLGATTPTVTEQVHVQAILVETIEQAAELRKKLKDGEDFASLARQHSRHTSQREGGDLGWLPREVMPAKFDEVAFSLEPATISEPFSYSTEGFWVIRVLAKATAREIDPDKRDTLKTRALEAWLREEAQNNLVERYFDSDKYAWVTQRLREQK